MSQFASFYVAAQVIERVLELFSNAPLFTSVKKSRKIIFWLIASLLGFLCSWLIGLRFFSASGLEINLWLDRILSGIALGSGTKPLHDLISYMEKVSGNK